MDMITIHLWFDKTMTHHYETLLKLTESELLKKGTMEVNPLSILKKEDEHSVYLNPSEIAYVDSQGSYVYSKSNPPKEDFVVPRGFQKSLSVVSIDFNRQMCDQEIELFKNALNTFSEETKYRLLDIAVETN